MEKILKAISELDSKIDKSISALDSRINKSIGALDSKINKSISALDFKIDKSISALDAKIDKLDKKFEKRFDQVDARFEQVDARFDQQDVLINTVATQVNVNTYALDKLTCLYLQHDQRLDRIEATMATKNDVREIHKTLDWLVAKFTKFEQELLLLAHRSTIHTDQITALQNAR